MPLWGRRNKRTAFQEQLMKDWESEKPEKGKETYMYYKKYFELYDKRHRG